MLWKLSKNPIHYLLGEKTFQFETEKWLFRLIHLKRGYSNSFIWKEVIPAHSHSRFWLIEQSVGYTTLSIDPEQSHLFNKTKQQVDKQ